MKKLIITAVIAFAAGIGTGILVKGLLGKKRANDECDEESINNDCAVEECEGSEEGPVEDEEETLTAESLNGEPDRIYSSKVKVPDEDEEDLDEEDEDLIRKGEEAKQYKSKHRGKIELISKSEWESDFPAVDYDRQELWYFPDEGTLTDEEGNELDLYEYVGNCFDKINFYTSTDEECWIRHNPKETDYYIHKEAEIPKDIFFNN